MILPIYVFGQPVLRKVAEVICQNIRDSAMFISTLISLSTTKQIPMFLKRDASRFLQFMRRLHAQPASALSGTMRTLNTMMSGLRAIWLA